MCSRDAVTSTDASKRRGKATKRKIIGEKKKIKHAKYYYCCIFRNTKKNEKRKAKNTPYEKHKEYI